MRPISTLATGECYTVLADGRFERRQLEPFRGAGPERLRAPSGRAPASRSVAENDVGIVIALRTCGASPRGLRSQPCSIRIVPAAVRTLHPLVLPARVSDPLPGERLRRGLYVGTQTTGFDPRSDAEIELGLLPFTYTVGGRIVDVFHDAAQVHRNDPHRALTPQFAALTGLIGADVRGASVDV